MQRLPTKKLWKTLVEVKWIESAKEELESLDQPIQTRILDKITWFKKNFEYLTPKPPSGEFQEFYKLRVGDWRVIYDLSDQSTIVIRAIGHRNDIYR